MSVLENQIPTLPISSENVYYTDMQNNTKMLNIYLNHIDIFKEQMLLILQNINKYIKNLKETAVTDPIVLPISAANVNYTKADESIVPLDSFLENIVTIEKVDAANPFVGISKVHELTEGADVQYSTYVASNIASFFQYYRTADVSGDLLNLGMFVAGYHPSFTPGIMFLIDKYTGKIEVGKKTVVQLNFLEN
jgi:hypothetical protein